MSQEDALKGYLHQRHIPRGPTSSSQAPPPHLHTLSISESTEEVEALWSTHFSKPTDWQSNLYHKSLWGASHPQTIALYHPAESFFSETLAHPCASHCSYPGVQLGATTAGLARREVEAHEQVTLFGVTCAWFISLFQPCPQAQGQCCKAVSSLADDGKLKEAHIPL